MLHTDSTNDEARYCVGIDLGTTNCCLSFVPRDGSGNDLRVLDVPQLVREGEVNGGPLLPSFLYMVAEAERRTGAWRLPWQEEDGDRTAGALARDRGAQVPDRLVSSAKSWLCYGDADREGPILPWEAPDGIPRVSPVDASAAYLAHLRDAWNVVMAKGDPALALERQAVVLTVPASFDAVARELTVRAAEKVGLRDLTLLEEPQAALYAWIADRGAHWRDELDIGDRLLVLDIGGGTTDLSLIEVAEEDGELALKRVAVGDHILLGGDNMDLTLAHVTAQRLAPEGRLDRWQMQQLVHACRAAKETLFENPDAGPRPLTVVGRGSSLIAATLRTELTREESETVLVDGFFPRCARSARPEIHTGGLREIGLPYAADPAITRHLAAFVDRDDRLPTALLFNGGVMKAKRLRNRVAEVVGNWTEGPGTRVLSTADLDVAVARGAAYYGLARRGEGIRIRGGTARGYYIGVEAARPAVPGIPAPILALCVAPQGMEEGSETRLDEREFAVVVGERAEFRFFSSIRRSEDLAGKVVDRWEPDEITELSPIVTQLDPREIVADTEERTAVPVQLHTRVTEIGTLELYFLGREDGQRWRLEFDVKEHRRGHGEPE
ncbi:MAG: nucleotide-binding protein [Gemmatimonadetes bacterium]|nr:nucleotide-binding protein [Gemmatimonadota bacterium]